MEKRLNLQYKLEDLFDSPNVYYDPPNNYSMNYPAVKFKRDMIKISHADNTAYMATDRYQIMIIDEMPNNPIIKKLLALPMCSYDREYTADGMHHVVLQLYF